MVDQLGRLESVDPRETWPSEAADFTPSSLHLAQGSTAPLTTPTSRLHALDALRGILALVVVFHHVGLLSGCPRLQWAADFAVEAFFVMSGYVLKLSYDGRPFAFLLKRIVRLWPVYAVCIVAGYALRGRLPPLSELAWWPIFFYGHDPIVDLPAWSLFAEVWVAPLMPAMFWFAARGRVVALLVAAAYFFLIVVDRRLFPIGFFGVGIALANFNPGLPQRLPAWTLWLGRISYSLYLSHWIILNSLALALGKIGIMLAVPMVLPVAWLLWRTVEQPSIRWSRIAGALPDIVLTRLVPSFRD